MCRNLSVVISCKDKLSSITKIELITFFIGLSFGFVIFRIILLLSLKNSEILEVHPKSIVSYHEKIHKFYSSTMADKLFNEIKILCLVLTNPKSHKRKAIHVKRTWGSRCNKLIFLTSKDDEELNAKAIKIKDKYINLWGKIKLGFQDAYEKYGNEFDWFVKGDDDSYFIIENLRHKLYQYHPETAIVIGHKFAYENPDGYMSGSGYILSKKAMKKFVEHVKQGKCEPGLKGAEDVLVGKCLQGQALLVDGHDVNNEKQFFPIDILEHFKRNESELPLWYRERHWSKIRHGGLSCCSSNLILLHYRTPQQMYLMDFLLYSFHHFGLIKDKSNILPRKLTFEQTLEAANEESPYPDVFKFNSSLRNFQFDELF